MNNWIFLAIAILAETVATTALKASAGFTRVLPSALVVLGYGIAFYMLALTLRSIPPRRSQPIRIGSHTRLSRR